MFVVAQKVHSNLCCSDVQLSQLRLQVRVHLQLKQSLQAPQDTVQTSPKHRYTTIARVGSFSSTKDLVRTLNNTQFQRKEKRVQKQKSLLWDLLSWSGVNWMDKRHWKTFHLSRGLTGHMDTSWMRRKTSSSFFYRSSWLCSTLLDEWEPTWTFTVRAHDFMDKIGEMNHIRHYKRP